MAKKENKQERLLDWLHMGVRQGVITEPQAKKIYETRYSKLSKDEFLEKMYDR